MKFLLTVVLCLAVASADVVVRDSASRTIVYATGNAAGNIVVDSGSSNVNAIPVAVPVNNNMSNNMNNNMNNNRNSNRNNNGNNNNDCNLDTVYINTQAVAALIPATGNVTGTINFYQANGAGVVTIDGTIYGLGSNGRYGLHINEYGNLGNRCQSTGQHFNPDGYQHGDLSDPVRHAGDLGNIVSNVNGTATFSLQSNAFSINGDYDVVGRAIVVDSQADDLGRGTTNTMNTGSSSRLACGIIGVGSEQMYNNGIQQTNMNAQG